MINKKKLNVPKYNSGVFFSIKKFGFIGLLRSVIYAFQQYTEINPHLKQFYSKKASVPTSKQKYIIFMADGKIIDYPGLLDRLRAIVSLYSLCKKYNIQFKIYFTHPFLLSDYIISNHHDWIIDPADICYNSDYAMPKFFPQLNNRLSQFIAMQNMKKKYQQIHFYTNCRFADDQYGILLKELFKPVEKLQNTINYHLEQIGDEFVTLGFRFSTLLGDLSYKDPKLANAIKNNNLKVLSDNDKESLILNCKKQIEKITSETNKKIFIITDSEIFLQRITGSPNIYYVSGGIRDIGLFDKIEDDIITKTFLDYYIAANSQKVITIVNKGMYRSNFHYYAALHNNVPYEIREF